MSIETQIQELIAAIRENTAALTGNASAAKTGASDEAPAKTTRKTKSTEDAPAKSKGYEAKYTKAEAQAAANEVKENKGVAAAKAIIADLGFAKLAEIEKPEDIDRLYEACKAALAEGEEEM